MPTHSRVRLFVRISAYCITMVAAIFGALVASKIVLNVNTASASSLELYPSFCLGGWNNPQAASGEPESSHNSNVPLTNGNASTLLSSVSSHIYCGYFKTDPRSRAPEQVTVSFRWYMAYPPSVPKLEEETLSARSGLLIASSTGLIPVGEDAGPQASSTLLESASATPGTPNDHQTAATTTEPDAEPTSSAEWKLLSFIASDARADASPPPRSSSPFLEISYSLDGAQWISIGTVGDDNWKGYEISVPVASWEELSRLQIMVAPIPSVAQKPDIYLDGMVADIEYDRTAIEAVDGAAAAVADSIQAVADKAVSAKAAQPSVAPQERAPRQIRVVREETLFSPLRDMVAGHGGKALRETRAPDQRSLIISGTCSKRYYVILLFRALSDIRNRPSSYVQNEARECDGGSFSYDLASFTQRMKSGDYYLIAGEEDESGPWTPVSGVYPLSVQASSTSETISE